MHRDLLKSLQEIGRFTSATTISELLLVVYIFYTGMTPRGDRLYHIVGNAATHNPFLNNIQLYILDRYGN